MPYRKLLTVLLCLAAAALAAQGAGRLAPADRDTLAASEARLASLAEVIYTDSSAAARFSACRDLIRELVTALDRPNSFGYTFGEVPGLSIQYAPDSTFRIFTWELYVDRDDYRHYGAIQRNAEELSLVPLLDRGDQWLENPENAIVGADNWLGYAVYAIAEGGSYRGQPYYFLFGYDSYDGYRRRKIMDVLTFTDKGPQFGLPVFATFTEAGLPLEGRARLILMYGAEATVALRFDPEQGGVVYENLVMMPGSYGEGPVNMPDGSYHLLRYDDADHLWHEEDQLFTHKYDEAPREAAKPGGGRDIIGRDSTRQGGGNRP